MPVFLFTYHAYGTWLPDRPEGYLRRREGLQPSSREEATRYRRRMIQSPVVFDEAIQKRIIEAVKNTEQYIDVTTRMVATDPTHAHVLLQWSHRRGPKSLRQSVKTAISIALKKQEDKQWLSGGATGKQVKDEEHLHHLEWLYLPGHRGWKWVRGKGLFK
ncbi:MAG: hypothetical protein AAGA29_11200 [Planctomycetota bacterium]